MNELEFGARHSAAGAGDTAGAPTETARLQGEQIRILFAQQPAVLGANVVVASIVGCVLASEGPVLAPLIWMVAVIAIAAGRFLLWRKHWRAEPLPTEFGRWANIAVGGAALSACVWGIGLAILFPADILLQMLVIVALAGMSAGAAAALSCYQPAFYAFIMPSVLPMALRLFTEGTTAHAAMGAMVLAYAAALVAIAHNFSNALARSHRLQLEKDDLLSNRDRLLATLEQRVDMRTAELTASNAKLKVEITERHRAERAERRARGEAERANAAKSKFLATASHDLRQPFQAMRLFHHLLVTRLLLPGDREIAHRLGEAMQAGEELLSALLDVSTLEAGTVEPRISSLPVGHMLVRLAQEFEPQANAKGLEFRLVPSSALVKSDPVLLERMLRNLLNNALRYTHRGGILLGCRRRGDRLRLEVVDTGVGIPPEKQEAVFEDFFQIGNPERDRAQGLGLGLPIVARTARLLGHPVAVRSRPGHGSVFSVTLPLAIGKAEERAPSREPALTPMAGSSHSILIIEDDREQLLGMKMMLEAWGYRVTAASSAEKALVAIRSVARPPALVISDFRLPSALNGVETIARLAEIVGHRIPGIILTGDTDPDRLREAKQSGYVLLHKPFAPEKLREIVASVAGP